MRNFANTQCECKEELCKTLLPVMDSPMSPPPSERGPSQDTPLIQSSDFGFRASYHIQNTKPYDNVSQVRCTGCMVCGRSVKAIERERMARCMEWSTPKNELESIPRLRREAYVYCIFNRRATKLEHLSMMGV